MTVASTFLEVRCLCHRLLFKVMVASTGRVQVKCKKCGLVNEVVMVP